MDAVEPTPVVDPAEPAARKSYVNATAKSLLEGEREDVVIRWLRKKGLNDAEIERTLKVAHKKVRKQVRRNAPTLDPEAQRVEYQRRQRWGTFLAVMGLVVALSKLVRTGRLDASAVFALLFAAAAWLGVRWLFATS